jgi:hypothetical protein
MYSGLGLIGVMPFATPENGSGCREQTSRVSTPAERSKAQNNWAPKSRDPWKDLACFRKSSLDRIVSASRRIASCQDISEEQHRHGEDGMNTARSFTALGSSAQCGRRNPGAVTLNLLLNASLACFNPSMKVVDRVNCDMLSFGLRNAIVCFDNMGLKNF